MQRMSTKHGNLYRAGYAHYHSQLSIGDSNRFLIYAEKYFPM